MPDDTDDTDDTAHYLDQARWLLDWHNRRSEALTTRAVALLGFIGAILALLLQGVGLHGVAPTASTWLWVVASTASLLLAALFCILTIAPSGVQMPAVNELRRRWAAYARSPVAGAAQSQSAEDLLNSSMPKASSPLTDALSEADMRAHRFSVAVAALLASLAMIVGLLFNLLLNV